MKNIDSYRITRPTSAFVVLGRVIALIREEYRRLRMGTVLSKADVRCALDVDERPACGTVGCIAGWTGFVAGVSGLPIMYDVAHMLFPRNEDAATSIHNYGFVGGKHFELRDGTKEQATATIRYIERVRKAHERELKRTIILPGGEVKGIGHP